MNQWIVFCLQYDFKIILNNGEESYADTGYSVADRCRSRTSESVDRLTRVRNAVASLPKPNAQAPAQTVLVGTDEGNRHCPLKPQGKFPSNPCQPL